MHIKDKRANTEHRKRLPKSLRNDPPRCAICLGLIKGPHTITKCIDSNGNMNGHRFHHDCLDEWCGNNSTCPVCRYQFPEKEISIPKDSYILVKKNPNYPRMRI